LCHGTRKAIIKKEIKNRFTCLRLALFSLLRLAEHCLPSRPELSEPSWLCHPTAYEASLFFATRRCPVHQHLCTSGLSLLRQHLHLPGRRRCLSAPPSYRRLPGPCRPQANTAPYSIDTVTRLLGSARTWPRYRRCGGCRNNILFTGHRVGSSASSCATPGFTGTARNWIH
jgi:hypothetical protein